MDAKIGDNHSRKFVSIRGCVSWPFCVNLRSSAVEFFLQLYSRSRCGAMKSLPARRRQELPAERLTFAIS